MNDEKHDWEELKEDAAEDVGVDLDEGGNLTAEEAGRVGGQMVKRLIHLGRKELREKSEK